MSLVRASRAALAVALATLLGGCASVPLLSLYRLSQLDPLTADVAQLRVAVRMPDAFGVRRSGATLTLSAERAATGLSVGETFVLQRGDEREAARVDDARRGFSITVYRIAENDIARLDALRAQIRAWKAQDPDGTRGSLGVNVSGCRRDAAAGADDAVAAVPVSTYLQTDAEQGFIVLTRDVDLREVAARGGVDALTPETLPPCARPKREGE